jgi:hypothetical protein
MKDHYIEHGIMSSTWWLCDSVLCRFLLVSLDFLSVCISTARRKLFLYSGHFNFMDRWFSCWLLRDAFSIRTVESGTAGWFMNWKGSGRMRLCPNEVLSQHLPWETRNNVSQARFEPSTSGIRVQSVAAEQTCSVQRCSFLGMPAMHCSKGGRFVCVLPVRNEENAVF